MKTIAVIYFGSGFEWLLEYWIQCAQKACGDVRLCLITDSETVIPEFASHLDFHRFSVTAYQNILRSNVAMDRKEVLAILAMENILGDLLVIDCDALIQINPFNFIRSDWTGSFGMTPDPFPRILHFPNQENCENWYEHNAGVLYFPRIWRSGDREEIGFQFRHAWDDLRPMVKADSGLLGQKAWSLTHYRLSGFLMPKLVNWSWRWGPNRNAAIVHYHGTQGKQFIHEAITNNASTGAR